MREHTVNDVEIWAYVSNTADKATEEKINRWFNSVDFNEELYKKIEKLHNATGKNYLDDSIDIEIEKQDFFNKIETKKSYKLNSFYKYVAVIALVLGAIIYAFSTFYINDSVMYKTVYSEQKKITLPDGSLVFLNSSSKISFNKNTPRTIYLEGEAFFEVKKDKKHPFTVETLDQVKVKALGTSFNVKSYPNGLFTETTLLTGSVAVTSKKYFNDTILMSPNDKVKIEKIKGKVVKSSLKITENEITCQNNKIHFNNKTFKELAYDLDIQHNIKISFSKDSNIANSRFTGYFDYKTPVKDMLEVLKISKNFNYKYIQETNEWIIE